MEIFELLTKFNESLVSNQENDAFDLTIPFTFFNDEQAITLHIQKNQAGYYDIDDKGNVLRYLNNIDANILDHKDKIEIICTLFSLKIEDNLVKGIIGYGTNQTSKQFFNFLQGISHLSTIKYLN